MNYITIDTYKPTSHIERLTDVVCLTVQDAVCDIPSLFKQFDGHLDDLFRAYNNGALFQSEVSVFVDDLNPFEVQAYNKYLEQKEKIEKESAETERLFNEWKEERARIVAERRSAAADAIASGSQVPTVNQPSVQQSSVDKPSD